MYLWIPGESSISSPATELDFFDKLQQDVRILSFNV